MASARARKASPLDRLPEELRGKLRKASFPDWVAPMKASLTDEYFSDPEWLFERKLDGVRVVAFKQGSNVQLYSRNQILQNNTYPELVEALADQSVPDCVLDGEIVAFAGQRDSFAELQGRMGIRDAKEARATGIPVHLYLFDLLHCDGWDTTRLPLLERKALLEKLLSYDDTLRFTEHRLENGDEFLDAACGSGWEGLIAKKANSVYQPGRRSPYWLKFKCSREQEFVIAGYTEPSGSRGYFGALLLGYYDSAGELQYAGKVGTGFTHKELATLHKKMTPLERQRSAFAGEVKERGAHWLKPKLVGQVAFTEWTGEGRLRHPRFIGLRDDKQADQVVREEASHAKPG